MGFRCSCALVYNPGIHMYACVCVCVCRGVSRGGIDDKDDDPQHRDVFIRRRILSGVSALTVSPNQVTEDGTRTLHNAQRDLKYGGAIAAGTVTADAVSPPF